MNSVSQWYNDGVEGASGYTKTQFYNIDSVVKSATTENGDLVL